MTVLDIAYAKLAYQVLSHGYLRPSRVGETISLPGMSLTTPPVSIEFPIVTTRKIFYKGVIGELAAFLKGATTLQEFKDFGCNYWHHNAAQWPRNFGKPESEWRVGRIYGAQWRMWGNTGFDQLEVLIDGIKSDTYGRRHILTTWDPEDLPNGCLPPCHLLAQFYAHNTSLDCVVYMRSVDIALGLPSDLVLYGALLMLVAKAVNRKAGRLIFHFGDAHVYKAHVKGMEEQLKRRSLSDTPHATLLSDADIFSFKPSQFVLTNYDPMDALTYDLF